MVFADIFRSHDIGGGVKALWIIFIILLPFFGVLAYLLFRGGSMHQRAASQAALRRKMCTQHIQDLGNSRRSRPTPQARRSEGEGFHHHAEFQAEKAKVFALVRWSSAAPRELSWPAYRLPMGMPRCYLICAKRAVRVHALSRALSDTGLAGHPDEYFVTGPPEAFHRGPPFGKPGLLARHHGVDEREEFLRLVYRVGSTPNGVFGANPVELRPLDD